MKSITQKWGVMLGVLGLLCGVSAHAISVPKVEAGAKGISITDVEPLKTYLDVVNFSSTNPIPSHVLHMAIAAYQCARNQGYDKQQLLTVIDFSLPSKVHRLWVLDLKTKRVLFTSLVAHGRNSGLQYATKFSNVVGSKESSLGLYQTGKTFVGNDGLSLRLHGLEKGFNNNAYARDIVIHMADYVSHRVDRAEGRIGRSWGCPAIPKTFGKALIEKIKGGSLLFIYYPEVKWLKESKFLHCKSGF